MCVPGNERAAGAQILGGGYTGPACRFYVDADKRLLKMTLCLGNVQDTAAVGAITLSNRVIDTLQALQLGAIAKEGTPMDTTLEQRQHCMPRWQQNRKTYRVLTSNYLDTLIPNRLG